ncbi:mitochondrial substrate carrier family protein ucpB isoform X1 [Dendrobium catenatum]|uniref:Mitochondrial uncoupling protein 1 n=1 Tax=Dendrobium catenatum TaxID=906689 RepID=A0A2I0VXV4_9ASPA|nr:mitochondrial substrate carrier family protein ucpB isoform X1 [Dendrobium catenatum]XP_028555282.1 mitochondrial substrate carrier family protein ucpB isoform X1 [Dendrobium catenatum]PKU68243.1 Mitochondrial uncoupling protein 1 [Dendrobium catenatum]
MDSKDDRDKEWSTSLPYALCHFSTSGGAVAVATAFTHPLDVVKVRLQMQLLGQRGPLVGMGETFGRIIKVEGVRGLYLGLVPALTRSTLYGGLRLGLYQPCKYLSDLMVGSTNIFVKIASGAFSGALATALTNPMEVLKVRLQMNSRRGLTGEIHKIISEEGFRALWKGVGPAMTRAGALTASQLVTYDESKQALLKWTHLEEGFHLHLISSFVAGTVGTLVTAPVDMLKTRLMLQQDSRGPRIYRNVFHCAYQVVLTEGAGALYKGGFATFARIGPQTTITFLVCEKLRKLAGMNAM